MSDDNKHPDLSEILSTDLRGFVDDILHTDGGIEHFRELLSHEQLSILENQRKLDLVTRAGVSFTRERDINHILNTTLSTARKLTNADGGTIYILNEVYADNPIDPGEIKDRHLLFKSMQNETMGTNLSGKDIMSMPPVPLDIDGQANLNNVSAYCVNTGKLLNFEDVYDAEGFDFSGTREYDKNSGYRSKSMLVIPLEDHENRIIGVLQLINRRGEENQVFPFTDEDIELVQGVSFPASAAITTHRLIQEQRDLFNAFVTVLAQGLGEKSPHTFNHIRRVAALSEALSQSVGDCEKGPYGSIKFNDDEMEEIRLAGWMHDIGKITTPEHIVGKQVKLQVVMDRFELIAERFNSKIKDYRIAMLEQQLAAFQNGEDQETISGFQKQCQEQTEALFRQFEELYTANTGGEFMAGEKVDNVRQLSELSIEQYININLVEDHGYNIVKGVSYNTEPIQEALLNEEERDLFLIERGTLSDAERKIINDHADNSWRWLMALPFPRKQKRLPLYAGAHHEHLNGKGYPNQIPGEKMPIQARIIAIADVYEALLANDRPYKKPMKLSLALSILGDMVKNGALDGEVMKIFLQSGGYMEYAEEYLDSDQIDEVDINAWITEYYVEPTPLQI